MASRNPSEFISSSENNSSEETTKQFNSLQQCVLSEAVQKHMQLIGAFLVQIIREWNECHAHPIPELETPERMNRSS